jgi:flagellar hook protein FlgE
MSINSAFGISLSGLDFAQRSLAVSANNVANVNTPGFKASEAVGTALAGGGVSTAVRPTRAAPDEIGNLDGSYTIGSNTDLVHELVSRSVAVAAYRANLSAIRSEDQMTRTLLRI